MDSFTNLQDIIPKIAGKYKLQSAMQDAHICAHTNKLLQELFPNDKNNENARAMILKKRTLFIIVKSSGISQKIMLHKLSILGNLREKNFDVESIITKIG